MPAKLHTTVGQLVVNDVLPADMRDYQRVLDKPGVKQLLHQLATEHPDQYRDVAFRLANVGRNAAYVTGGHSFGLRHLRMTPSARKSREQFRLKMRGIVNDNSLSDEQRERALITMAGRLAKSQGDTVYREALADNNPLAYQILSGAKGSKLNLTSLLASDMLYADHRGRVLPVPVLRSYSQGLSPVEHWASSYGARKGIVDVKLATADAGFLSKQLGQIVHRNVVTGVDADEEPTTLRGMPVDTDDPDNAGTLLAMPVAGYARNTVLTPKILADIQRRGHTRLLIRSPIAFGSPDGGVYARDVGVREFGRLPVTGENVGFSAAQAIGEPLAQTSISSKHSGGVVGASADAAIGGFESINQMIQTPRVFKGGATHSEHDGRVTAIESAPAGGAFVVVNGARHYVPSSRKVTAHRGDMVEAGDVLSDGTPNPAMIVKYKGVGAGRRHFVDSFLHTLRNTGLARRTGTRRNVELLARSLINHVELTDEHGDYAPGDIVPYSMLEHSYKPRDGFRELEPHRAIGQYLESPYLHYTIGTRVRPSMLRDFREFGIKRVNTHPDAPPFQPTMVRGMAAMRHDPDWMTRMLGSGLQSSLMDSVRRGGVSDTAGTSFVPTLANPTQFGLHGKVITPHAPDPVIKSAAPEQPVKYTMDNALDDMQRADVAWAPGRCGHGGRKWSSSNSIRCSRGWRVHSRYTHTAQRRNALWLSLPLVLDWWLRAEQQLPGARRRLMRRYWRRMRGIS